MKGLDRIFAVAEGIGIDRPGTGPATHGNKLSPVGDPVSPMQIGHRLN